MKKLLLTFGIVIITLLSSGCATWDGIKQDSTDAYDSTKKAINEATN